jgi:hypothetical protein
VGHYALQCNSFSHVEYPSATLEYEEDAAEARADFKAGRPRYLRVGPPPSADSRFAAILKLLSLSK